MKTNLTIEQHHYVDKNSKEYEVSIATVEMSMAEEDNFSNS